MFQQLRKFHFLNKITVQFSDDIWSHKKPDLIVLFLLLTFLDNFLDKCTFLSNGAGSFIISFNLTKLICMSDIGGKS